MVAIQNMSIYLSITTNPVSFSKAEDSCKEKYLRTFAGKPNDFAVKMSMISTVVHENIQEDRKFTCKLVLKGIDIQKYPSKG